MTPLFTFHHPRKEARTLWPKRGMRRYCYRFLYVFAVVRFSAMILHQMSKGEKTIGRNRLCETRGLEHLRIGLRNLLQPFIQTCHYTTLKLIYPELRNDASFSALVSFATISRITDPVTASRKVCGEKKHLFCLFILYIYF